MNFLTDNQFIFNYRRMWPFIRPYFGRAVVGVLLTIPVGLLNAAVAAFLKPFTDGILVGKDLEFSQVLPFIVVGFTLVQSILSYAATYVNGWVGSKIVLGLKRALYLKLLSMDPAYYDRRNSGEILFRFSSDPETAIGGLISNLKFFLTKIFSTIGFFGVMLYNSWQLTIIAIGVFALAVYPVRYVRSKAREISRKTVEASSGFLTIYNETFSGNKIINSFTLEDRFRERFDRNLQFLFRLGIKLTQGSGWLSPLLHFISSIGLALVLGFGAHLIVSGAITTGNFVAFIAAMMMLYDPLKTLGNNYTKMQLSFMAIDRIYEILDTRPAIKSHEGTTVLRDIREGIEFKNVSFGYTPETRVLIDISFRIKVGQTVALVGNSGGGKTTVSSLIPRLYDVDDGRILIDGLDIRDYSLVSLRQNVAVVFQDNFLFSGSIRENLQLGNPAAMEEDMWRALGSANLADFVKSCSNGLDTVIGERGVLFSGGQKQRLAIARAFIKDAPLVILDEATSSLDNQAEKAVQQALENLMKDRTVIVIAHRLSTIQNADNILVVSDGRIIEQGRHSELMVQKGAYYALYSTRFADGDADRPDPENHQG